MKKLIKIKLYTGLLIISLFPFIFQACDYDYFVPQEVELPDTVSFSTDILPIFTQSCLGSSCHSSGGIPPELTEENAFLQITLLGYADTSQPEESILYQKLISTTKPMPPDEPLPEKEKQLILAWIKQGTLDN